MAASVLKASLPQLRFFLWLDDRPSSDVAGYTHKIHLRLYCGMAANRGHKIAPARFYVFPALPKLNLRELQFETS